VIGRAFGSRRVFLVGTCLAVGIFLVAPTLVVIPLSFTDQRSFAFPPGGWSTKWYENFFADETWYSSALYSLEVGAIVTIVATVLGVAGAVGLAHGRGRWRAPVRGMLLAPMIVPGVITAIGIYYVFLRAGLTESLTGFVLAHTVLALPLVVITVSASLQGLDRQLEWAAASLGASPWRVFRQVTLPLIVPGIATGALFAFLTSFDESIVSLFLSGPYARTLPIQVYQSVTSEVDPTIAAASTMLVGITVTLMLILALVSSRKK